MPTRSELFELARVLGHENPRLIEKGGRFFVTCSCGYKSTMRRTEVDALGAGVHHALGAARDALSKNSGRRIDELLHSRAS